MDRYSGRVSDECLTKDCGFYNLWKRSNQGIADRAFLIKNKLLLRFCNLEVLPGARMKSHITSAVIKKQKMWLNVESMLNLKLIVSKVLKY